MALEGAEEGRILAHGEGRVCPQVAEPAWADMGGGHTGGEKEQPVWWEPGLGEEREEADRLGARTLWGWESGPEGETRGGVRAGKWLG